MKPNLHWSRRAFLCAGAGAPAWGQLIRQSPPEQSEIPPGELLGPEQAPAPIRGKRWRLRYEFELPEDRRQPIPPEVLLGGLAFATPRLGMAWLSTVVARDPFSDIRLDKGYVVVTRDGGANWTPRQVKGFPRFVYSLNEGHTWLLTSRGIFFSREFGADWESLKTPFRRLTRLHFLDERTGFAFGLSKTFWRTRDGGKSWQEVPESKALAIQSPYTWVSAMSFFDRKRGLAAGGSRPERRVADTYLDVLPPWMAPERAARRRELPGSIFVFETRDAGETWDTNIISGFGTVREVRTQQQAGIAVLQHGPGFPWPSEVIQLYPPPKEQEKLTIFRRRRYTITDALPLEAGGYLLAGIEFPGRLHDAGIAGKLKVFYSPDGQSWADMRVHYSAQGSQGYLAGAGEGGYWAATDQGQILQLDD